VEIPVATLQTSNSNEERDKDDPLALGIDQLNMAAQTDYGTETGGDEEGPACRVAGMIKVNKVAGNLHITALGHGYGGQHVDHDGTKMVSAGNVTDSLLTRSIFDSSNEFQPRVQRAILWSLLSWTCQPS
jgi:hypothetical protein